MLSFHRFAAVKHPRLAQLSQRQFLPCLLATSAWFSAALLSVPTILAYNVTIYPNSSSSLPPTSSLLTKHPSTIASSLIKRDILYNDFNNSQQIQIVCRANFGSEELRISYIILFTLLVFVIPTFGVIMNHLGKKYVCFSYKQEYYPNPYFNICFRKYIRNLSIGRFSRSFDYYFKPYLF
jgi:hypothetical protein